MWIEENEKFALIGLAVKIEDSAVFGPILPDLWLIQPHDVSIPDHWKEWLGTIRIEALEACTAFLLTKVLSATPGILDGESIVLKKRVSDVYIGLLLSSPFAPEHDPIMLTGAFQSGEINIREYQTLEVPLASPVHLYPAVTPADVKTAAHIAQHRQLLRGVTFSRWRLNRVLDIYVKARTTADLLDRLHQYCRCIEGLILPTVGCTRKQFKSRTELFVGPRHHDLMGKIYETRSAVEHLHENQYLEFFDRAVRLDILKMEAISEYIARTSLALIIGTQPLWRHFANTSELADFWKRSVGDRQKIWGSVVDPLAPLANFNPTYVSNQELGAP